MATYPAKGGKDFAKVSAGTHLAVCTLVADVGLQPGSGMYPEPKVKVFFRFEVPSERTEYEKDGQAMEGPMVIYHNYVASMNPKANMRKAIESWRGAKFTDAEAEKFDVRKLAGQTCMIQVVHTADGQYANIANIMAPPKGTAKLKPEGTAIYYGPDDDSHYNELPKFLQKKVDEQLDHPLTSSPKVTSTPSATSTSVDDAFADAEAARQAAKGKAKLPPGDQFEDDDLDQVPF